MVMPAIAPLYLSLSLLPTIQTDKTKSAGQRQASFLSLSLFPRFLLSLSCRRLAAPLDFAGLFRALSWTAAVVVGRPRDKSQRPSRRGSDPRASQRHRGNINPLKNATAALLNGRRRRRNQRRTDRSAWKPVIKCELSSLPLSDPPPLHKSCRYLPPPFASFCPKFHFLFSFRGRSVGLGERDAVPPPRRPADGSA